MSFHAKTIRNLIGDDRLEEAIEMLIGHLEEDDVFSTAISINIM
jgi:hypothetical protein